MGDDHRALALASAAGLLGSLDTALNIAFPDLSDRFHLGVSGVQWVIVTYVLTNGALLVAAGRLGDRVGHERVLRAGLAISLVAFLGCGLAPTFGALLVARVLQGLGVTLVMSSGPALAALALGPAARGRALGRFQQAVALGLVIGPIAGGFLVSWWGWRAVFLFRVPLALAALVLAVRMRTTKVSQGNAEAARGGDVGGAVLLAALTAGTLGALSAGRTLGWGASATVLLAAGAICALAAFIIVERRSPVPTVDLSLFRVGPFAVANILNALTNGAAFVIWLLVPYLAVNVLGHPARVAGFVLAVAPMAMAVVAPRVGRLSDRIGAAAIASAGIAICAVGLLGLSRPAATTSTAFLVAVLAVIGLGLGTFQVPNMSFVMGSVGSERQGMAGGLTQMMRTVGIVASVSLASSVFDRRYHALRPLGGKAGDLADNAAWTEAFRYVVLLATLVAVGSAVLSVAGRGVRLNATARSR